MAVRIKIVVVWNVRFS